jgi:nitrogen fixation NifU-like protein
MSDDLYQQAILDRAKSMARAGRLHSPDASATVDNPLCGDRVTVDLKLADGKIVDVAHHVRGCALCQASASVMAEAAVGQDAPRAKTGREAAKALLAGTAAAAPWSGLEIFAPVRRHKSRFDCVLLPFEALAQALDRAART